MSKNDARRVSRSGNGTATSKKLSLEFLFKDINVRIKDKQILHNVSGIANSGEVLAVMGPSGSGKTTLLNSLAGRTPIESGIITLDDQPLTKRLRKRTCYVLQQDVFLSKLTLWETLYFATMVYLPESIPRAEKMAKMDYIIDVLDLGKCKDTVVGDQFTRGLSGGEKKRLSIACELIKDPDIMFLDEPTSGLDSSTAYTLMVLLKQFTEQSGKAVVIAYFGDGRKALDFFDELELYCEPHYNPADFILETVKKDKETVQKIIDLAETKRSTALWPAKLRHAATHLKGKHLTNLGSGVGPISNANGDVMVCLDDVEVENNATDVSVTANGSLSTSETSALVQKTEDETPPSSSRWATGFWMQFKMLNWRTYKQSRTRIISKYNIFQSMTIAIIVGLLWFQMERTHDNIKDRLGYLFFMATYWCFMPMFDAIVSFPAERPVFRKEREAGAYRLSALYFAKMSSEMPLILFMPTVFVTITYWMGGLRGVAHFFATWGILLLNVLNCQGIGYVIGSAIWDLQMCITSAAVFVLFGLLSAGYYVNRLPPWLTWARYLSIVCYPYNAMSILELGDLTPISCTNVTSMEMPACLQSNTTVVTPDDILESYGVLLPIYCYVCAIVIQLFFFRTIAYYVMKYKKKPH
ncbi:hypothetical protein BaRGS_00030481 [Batillaria attramentaria]|uniref:ABC transporter domain-containing protein n=1 Tax=Batillaria attramentaria TaxID=370345 RepID=A0ABD0JT49_9CAEN